MVFMTQMCALNIVLIKFNMFLVYWYIKHQKCQITIKLHIKIDLKKYLVNKFFR